MIRIVTAGLSSLLMVSTAFGQTKVGTTGATFLSTIPEARSAAMGGVAVSTGSYSDVYWNPAILGLNVDDTRYRLSFSPKGASGQLDSSRLNTYSALGPGFGRLLGIESFELGVGAYAIRLDSDQQVEHSSVPSGRTFSWQDAVYGLSCGAGHNSDRIQLAAGCAAKLVKENASDYSTESLAFDFGAIFRGQIARERQLALLGAVDVSSTIGMSLASFGNDLKLNGNTYPLPRTAHAGMSLECASAKEEGGIPQIWSALVSAEYRKLQVGSRERQAMIGFEIQALQTIALRLGDDPDEDSQNTWGLGVRSAGIATLLPDGAGGLASLVRDHLEIAFDFAEADGINKTRYYQLSIGYR